ncbi:MAG: response regulator transcription factor [Candidatus Shapirobacteria bacterium]|jgi:two-component system OmpR family response regulator
MKRKILLVEDNPDLQTPLKSFFLENNYLIDQAFTGAQAIKKVEESTPDLVILDLGLPDIDGETVFSRIKKYSPEIPVIILTARNTPKDAAKGLGLGADDYIPKPFDLDELLARVQARLRQPGLNAKLVVDDLSLDTKSYEVLRSGKKINLSPTEFNLLEYLMINRGKVLSREAILNRVWSYDYDVQTRVIDVYIGYLRKKIDEHAKTKLIHCIRGFGYTIK